MDESRGIGICHMAFILLYIGVVITAIDGRNILDISYAIFENSKLQNTSIELTNASNCIITNCEFEKVAVVDSDFRGFNIFSTYKNNYITKRKFEGIKYIYRYTLPFK